LALRALRLATVSEALHISKRHPYGLCANQADEGSLSAAGRALPMIGKRE